MSVRTQWQRVAGALLIMITAVGSAAAQRGGAPPNVLHVADLGTCPTLSGVAVRDCRVAYRTYGALNSARDNAVLIPSWYGGTSEGLIRLLGDGALVDTTQFFAILVDALGNGVSTSPSNSRVQPAASFPPLTIADLVAAQHRLVKEHLKLPALHAVVGFSMGGMQALEWAVRFPDDTRRVVSLLGTPRSAAHDVATFRTLRNLVHLAELTDVHSDTAWIPLAEFWHVIRATPARVNEMTVDQLDGGLTAHAAQWRTFDVYDNRLQIDALIQHDIAAHVDHDMARAAAAVRAELLIVVSPDDRIVGSGPALHFGELTGAEVMSVPSACGHFALYCEPEIGARVRAFLAGLPPTR